MKYDEELLRKLIAIYERRDANSAKLNRAIKLTFRKDKYPEYFDIPDTV